MAGRQAIDPHTDSEPTGGDMTDDQSGGSFSERYRGTQWGQPTGPASPPPQPRGTGPLVAIGVILLAIVGGVVVLALFASRPPTTGGPPPPTGPPATPRPTPGVEVRVLDAFWVRIRDPHASYKVAAQGRVRVPGEAVSFSMGLDVAGDDYAGRISFGTDLRNAPIVRKDGVVWVRTADGRWLDHKSNAAVYRQTPFMGLRNASELAYDGPVKVEGETLYRIVSTDRYRPGGGLILDPGSLSVFVDSVRLELLVTETGVPRQASFRMEMGGRDARGEPVGLATASYTFTKFGSAFTIEAPER
jgi:hypothetical protein